MNDSCGATSIPDGSQTEQSGDEKTYSLEPFAAALLRLKKEQEMSYRQLADKAGYTGGYLCHLTQGIRQPTGDTITRIARALCVSPDYFREYRLVHLNQFLEDSPELALRLYRKLADKT